MKLLFLALLFPAVIFAQTQDQILSISASADTVIYVFAYKSVSVDLSGAAKADAEYLRKIFWMNTFNNDKYANVKMCSKDSVEHVAMMAQLKTLGIEPSAQTICLSDAEKADVIASKIIDKAKIVKYLKLCATLRADNPDWKDATVRAVAQGGV